MTIPELSIDYHASLWRLKLQCWGRRLRWARRASVVALLGDHLMRARYVCARYDHDNTATSNLYARLRTYLLHI